MGAETFITQAEGETADAAFDAAVSSAQHWYGHGGYTGTIAEKDSFVMVTSTPMSITDAGELAHNLIRSDDPRIDDKWGPAGCISLDTGGFLFFGWAAS